MRERVPILEFVMPYGKHSGKKLTDIWYLDKQYLNWGAKKFKDTVGKRICEFIEVMNDLDRVIGSTDADIRI